jgi:uncharacterized alpha-E superfamily protein
MLRTTVQPVELSRGGNELPSRVADNLYWLGRYAERAEGTTRLLRGILARMTEKTGLAEAPELPLLLRALTRQCQLQDGTSNGEHREHGLTNLQAAILPFLLDKTRPSSLDAVLHALQSVAARVRDRISIDMWRVIGNLHLEVASPAPGVNRRALPPEEPPLGEVLDLLNRTIITLSAFGGLAMESMTRAQGWRFLDMGRRLERSLYTINLIRSTLSTVPAHEGLLLEALLEIADSSMTYRRRYMGSLQASAVLDLLIADESNPRSLAFQMVALAEDVDNLPRDQDHPGRTREQRLMLATLTELRLADMEQIVQADVTGQRPLLDQLLGRLAAELPTLSDSITQHYLSHLLPLRHLACTPGEGAT